MPEISLPAFEEAFDDGLKSVRSTPWLALQLKILERLYNRVEETIHPSQRQSYDTELTLLLSQVIRRGREQDFQTLSPEILTFSLSRLSRDDFPKAYQKVVFSLVRTYIRLQAYSELAAILSEAGLVDFTDSGVEGLLSSGKELDEAGFRAQVLPRVSSEVKAEVEAEWQRRGYVSSSDSVLGLFVVHQGEENTGVLSRVELSHLRVIQKEVMDQVRVVSHLVGTGDLFSDQSHQVCVYLKMRYKLPLKRSLRLEYSIDQPATHLGGNSIGLVLAVLGGMGLYTYNRNRPFKYVVYEDVAFTGALDEDGKVLPVNKEMLPPKLEAAFYSGVNTVVLPSKQLKEARAVIKQLQSRYPRRITLIPVQSYEEVLARREVLHLQRRQIKERSRQFVKDHANGVTLSAMVFVVILLLGFWFGIVKNGEPASFTKTNEDRVVIRNKYGFALWKTEPGVSSKEIVIEDIDGDDEPEILTGYLSKGSIAPPSLIGNLVCYQSNGEIKWKTQIGKAVKYGENRYPNLFGINKIITADVNFDGEKEIICSAAHTFFPDRILLLSNKGVIIRDFWNSGFISCMKAFDLVPDNHTKEIIISGVNNEYRSGFFAVLDPLRMYGSSPQESEYYTNHDEPPGNAIYYVKFPLSHFQRIESRNKADSIRELLVNDKGELELVLYTPHLTGRVIPFIVYFFNNSMELAFMDLGDNYYAAYNVVFPDREPLPYNDPELLDYFRKVQYWDGDTWRDSATMNRRYTLPE